MTLDTWYSKELGDGIDAREPTRRIQTAFATLYFGRQPLKAAVFSNYDLEQNVVTLYFSPEAELLAKANGATPCKKPSHLERIALLIGDVEALAKHFSR